MTEFLLRQSDANYEHTAGMKHVANGRDEAAIGNSTTALEHFEAAHAHFGTGLRHLDTWEHRDTTDGIVQEARIRRDDGFTHTREGIVRKNPEDFTSAHDALYTALETTAPFIALTQPAQYAQANKHPKTQRREVTSEHMATAGAMARNAIAAEVLYGTLPEISDEDTSAWQNLLQLLEDDHLHGAAHDLGGNNGYYRTSNDMRNALQERARGNARLPHTAVALGRAVSSFAWTLVRDPSNISAASKEGHIALALRSPEAARAYILNRP